MRRTLACATFLGLAAVAAPTWAQGDDEEDEEAADEDEEEEEEEAEAKPKAKSTTKASKQEFKKQDLRGHAVEADKIANPFQKDRFFVDKVDTEKTEDQTLFQGSLQLSTFAYRESSGDLGADLGTAASKYGRYFGEMRFQTDARHIGGGRWDARIDARLRGVTNPDDVVAPTSSQDDARVQSGFNGKNEVDIRELWIVRSGKRSDFFLGRQFITDLGAIKIDGIRVDYASSEKLTFLGFAGLYPLRGSRSVFTDYTKLQAADEGTSDLTDAGRFVGAGGFGGAYRTINTHGSLGGVVLAPLEGERPRFYVVSNNYYRTGTALDLYHYALVDIVGSAGVALTNLSAGANYKPDPRLRLTASYNRVDTETLNVQAGAFLKDPVNAEGGVKVQNETILQLQRVATNAARGSISVGLGSLQRFEVSVAGAYRYRPDVTLTAPDGTTRIGLEAAKGVDITVGIMDRRSLLDLRLGIDVTRSIGLGDVAFNRSEVLSTRVFASREIGKGRGEWEAEGTYTTTRDQGDSAMAAPQAGLVRAREPRLLPAQARSPREQHDGLRPHDHEPHRLPARRLPLLSATRTGR